MKRFLSVIALILGIGAVIFCAACDPAASSYDEKDSVDQTGLKVNPKSVVGYVGDVMPYYVDGEMNIFYLQDGRNTNLGYHPFALMTTKDFVSYHDYGQVIPFENDLYSPDFALGTGSVIKVGNTYHCYYTGHNDNRNSGLPYFEIIQHATSTDKIHWTKHPDDGFYGGHNDFRDPYVYRSEEDNCYYMLVTTRVNDCGVIKRYKSTDLKKWQDMGVFFKNDKGTYNMECPTFIEYNGYYYLSYSEQGNFRVTHYRYKKNLNDPWKVPDVDYVDGVGLYAGRMEKDDRNLYMFGWCGTKDGEWDYGAFNWAGNLVTHRLVQNPDGTLRAQMIYSYKSEFNTRVDYKLSDGKSVESLSFGAGDKKAYKVEALASNITRINFKLNAKTLMGDCGLSFNTTANHKLSNLVVSFNLKNGYAAFFNKAESFASYGSAQAQVPFKFEANKDINVDILIDGQIFTVYLDDTIALTTRMYDMPKAEFSFFGNGAHVDFGGIAFYE